MADIEGVVAFDADIEVFVECDFDKDYFDENLRFRVVEAGDDLFHCLVGFIIGDHHNGAGLGIDLDHGVSHHCIAGVLIHP